MRTFSLFGLALSDFNVRSRRVASVALVAALAATLFNTGVATAAGKFHLEEATIADIHDAIKSGDITCKGLVQAYIARSKAYNGVCTQLVTANGAAIPAASGAVRGGAAL